MVGNVRWGEESKCGRGWRGLVLLWRGSYEVRLLNREAKAERRWRSALGEGVFVLVTVVVVDEQAAVEDAVARLLGRLLSWNDTNGRRR